MSLSQRAADKIETLVAIALRAVDQRLSTIREQLVELTNTVARNHADLQDTNDHVAELRATVEQLLSAQPTHECEAAPALTLPSPNGSPSLRIAQTRPMIALPEPISAPPAETTIPAPVEPGAAPAPVDPPTAMTPFDLPVAMTDLTASRDLGDGPGPDHSEFDIDAFSVQVNARLSALVERAICA